MHFWIDFVLAFTPMPHQPNKDMQMGELSGLRAIHCTAVKSMPIAELSLVAGRTCRKVQAGDFCTRYNRRCPIISAAHPVRLYMMAGIPCSTFESSLPKPMGLAFEEVEEGRAEGVFVSNVFPDGAAFAAGIIWPGDYLLKVGDIDVSSFCFEDVMSALRAAESPVLLQFERDGGRSVRVVFPDKTAAFGVPGDSLAELAQLAGFVPNYQCQQGRCGSCELFLDGSKAMPESACRTVRVCRARLPCGAGGEFALLSIDSPQAAESIAALQSKLERKDADES
mmetsp:Transcript_6722/g.14699  ORF Transcript_6722/g.14699 Transcript_6722/m.14699 type:complete len:281 (+) Transcript_6722:335-1177(+)